jgi:hypothetical protein
MSGLCKRVVESWYEGVCVLLCVVRVRVWLLVVCCCKSEGSVCGCVLCEGDVVCFFGLYLCGVFVWCVVVRLRGVFAGCVML